MLCVLSYVRSLSLGHNVESSLDFGANNKNEKQKEQGISVLQGTNKVIYSRFFIVYMRKLRPKRRKLGLNFHNWLALMRGGVHHQ